MLRDTDYMRIAEEYSTSIGMATWIDYQSKGEFVKGKSGDEADINETISLSILLGIYPQFIKKVYELQNGRKGRVKESTLYKRAYQLCK